MSQRILILFSLVLATIASAREFPSPKGRVNDFAGILKETTRRNLEAQLTQLDQTTTDEIAVVTVLSLEGEPIEEYANRLFKEWRIGKKGKDNGLLVLVAVNDRRMRIEVGYGLEQIVPDGLAGRIIRDQMTPAFKAGDFDQGIRDGVAHIVDLLQKGAPAPDEDADLGRITLMESVGFAAFLSVFVGLGFFMLGAGIGSKTGFPILWGSLFGGVPFLIGASGILGHIPQGILLCVAVLAGSWGLHIGRKPKSFLRQSEGNASEGWSWGSSTSGSSSGGSSGFGGGSSGGGGASGGW